MTQATERFRDQPVTLINGVEGRVLSVPTASPLNYHQVLSAPDDMLRIDVDGQLFLPPDREAKALPTVIVAPGSLGVGEGHLAHAATLTGEGFAAFVLDSFGERAVTSTVANQTQFSFAASAYDVLAAFEVLAELPEVDESHLGAQGHSRGGTAVLCAATRRLADAVLGDGRGFKAVYAAYPWCGHQFVDPRVGTTRVRVIIGDRDEWCLPMQAQSYCQAVQLTGGDASFRLVAGAHHSFDRETALANIEEAKISPSAPTAYIANDGAFVHPVQGEADAELVDRDLMVYALKAGYGRIGAHIGSGKGEPELFREDLLSFWTSTLLD
ncbi:MAG: dienelactone hydrolase family protein [Acidobacteriota bacterium]